MGSAANEFIIIAFCYERAGLVAVLYRMSRNFVVKRTHHNDIKFYFEMADAIAVFFNVNFTKSKHCHIKVCKKKNLSGLQGTDRQKIVPWVTVWHH